MRKEIFIVSNNSLAWAKYPVLKVDGGIDTVFAKIRDLVHEGNIILTHPLSGSIKPHETEFKSVVMEKKTGTIDYGSLQLIENAISTSAKLKKPARDWGALALKIENDFMTIDLSLLETGLDSLGRTLYKLIAI